MGELVYDDTERLLKWASKIIGFNPGDDARAVGWQEHGELRAVVVWDNFADCDCHIHVASDGKPHCMKMPFLRMAFFHPFVQWNMRRVTGLVPAKNSAALKFDLNLGFVQEGYLRNALPDDDLVILSMFREDCKFIPEKFKQWQPNQRQLDAIKEHNHG